MSSRPEEFHLRALPEPCMTLSSHTAPDVRPLPLNGFASSTGSSCFQLASGQGRTTQPLRSSPITGPSTLLRAAPPLRPAWVLSPSRLEPLAACPFTSSDVTKHRFSRSTRKPGRASRRLHAGCRSGSIRASPELIPEEGSPPVLTSPNPLSTLLQRFACARLSRPCLPKSCPGVSATLTTTAFGHSSLRWLEIGS